MSPSTSRPPSASPTRPDPPPLAPHVVARTRPWWHDPVDPELDLMHRMLITSPWQRYRLDRDLAASDDEFPRS